MINIGTLELLKNLTDGLTENEYILLNNETLTSLGPSGPVLPAFLESLAPSRSSSLRNNSQPQVPESQPIELTNTSIGDPDNTISCPEPVDLSQFGFWVEGVIQSVLCVLGVIANFISAAILNKDDMRNSFNFLLIALICMDSCVLIGSILESIRKSFMLVTDLHNKLFPYFLYPGLSIAVTASVYMTVGIAFERYIAVHYPIDYSQAINSPEACRHRLFKYVVPVVLVSILVNIPKFLECEWQETYVYPNGTVVLEEDLNVTNLEDPSIHKEVDLTITDLRNDPTYIIYYTNWTRLFAIGLIPTTMLIYFNYKIYKDVKNRNRRQMSMSRNSTNVTQTARRKQEDNLAVVFMGIVLTFLICHAPRNLLSIIEIDLIHKAIDCQNRGQVGFPYWADIGAGLSHLLLVINSSTNMILYIFLNKAFRMHFVKMLKRVVLRVRLPCRLTVKSDGSGTGEEDVCEGGAGDGNSPKKKRLLGDRSAPDGAASTQQHPARNRSEHHEIKWTKEKMEGPEIPEEDSPKTIHVDTSLLRASHEQLSTLSMRQQPCTPVSPGPNEGTSGSRFSSNKEILPPNESPAIECVEMVAISSKKEKSGSELSSPTRTGNGTIVATAV